MNRYQIEKENARNEAMEWQADFDNHNYSYGELCDYYSYFNKLAKRYGLVREFEENGVL